MPEASYIPDEATLRLRRHAVHAIFKILKNMPVRFANRITDLVVDERKLTVTDACDILTTNRNVKTIKKQISEIIGEPF